jgi:hypothetical protein
VAVVFELCICEFIIICCEIDMLFSLISYVIYIYTHTHENSLDISFDLQKI